MNLKNLKDPNKSKVVRRVAVGLGVAIVVLAIFHAGMIVGLHKAKFGSHMGDNYRKNFVDPRGGKFGVKFGRGFGDRNSLVGGHGTAGEIVSISLPQIVVADRDRLEKIVVVGSETRVRHFRDEVSITDLKVGDTVVVLGIPNDSGEVEAKLIRFVPMEPVHSVDTASTTTAKDSAQ